MGRNRGRLRGQRWPPRRGRPRRPLPRPYRPVQTPETLYRRRKPTQEQLWQGAQDRSARPPRRLTEIVFENDCKARPKALARAFPTKRHLFLNAKGARRAPKRSQPTRFKKQG